MSKYFGTDGVRGVAFKDITENLAYRIGRFLGHFPNGKKNKILIGRDTRFSGEALENALTEGILLSGSEVDTLRITTTPSISYIVQNGEYDFGIMISASHNPYEDNGIKVFSNIGEKLSADIEDLIEEYIDSEEDYLLKHFLDYSKVKYRKDLIEDYLKYLSKRTYTENLKTFNILIDCANGSSSVVAKHYFGDILNQNVTITNFEFNGKNINDNCGSTHIDNLVENMKNGQYDFGLSFDGDADRLIIVDEKGNVVDGDIFMYISALYLREKGKLNDDTIVVTKMSNLGLKKALEKQGINYFEVDVGDKYVQSALKSHGWSLGGEQSGHVMFFEDMNTGSGILSATKLISLLSEKNVPLSQLTKDILIYPQHLINVRVKDKKTILNNDELKTLIAQSQNDLQGNGRILVRPSGTENLIRVMVEAPTIEECIKNAERIASMIKQLDK